MKGIKGKMFIGDVDNEFEFEYGQLFKDVKHIREVLFDQAVLGGYILVGKKNDKVILTVCVMERDASGDFMEVFYQTNGLLW